MASVDLTKLAALIGALERKLQMSQKIKLPDTLPTILKGIDLFLAWRDQPSKLLSGVTPMELFKGPFLDIDRVWFTGSCAWTPLVTGKKWDESSDIDVCFYDQEQARSFVAHVIEKMEGAMFVGQEPNRFGGAKIFYSRSSSRNTKGRSDDDEVMDVFWLPPSGATIVELVSQFPNPHERVAIAASVGVGDVNAVTRLVRPWTHVPIGQRGAPEHRQECYACMREFEDHQVLAKKRADAERARQEAYADRDWS